MVDFINFLVSYRDVIFYGAIIVPTYAAIYLTVDYTRAMRQEIGIAPKRGATRV